MLCCAVISMGDLDWACFPGAVLERNWQGIPLSSAPVLLAAVVLVAVRREAPLLAGTPSSCCRVPGANRSALLWRCTQVAVAAVPAWSGRAVPAVLDWLQQPARRRPKQRVG